MTFGLFYLLCFFLCVLAQNETIQFSWLSIETIYNNKIMEVSLFPSFAFFSNCLFVSSIDNVFSVYFVWTIYFSLKSLEEHCSLSMFNKYWTIERITPAVFIRTAIQQMHYHSIQLGFLLLFFCFSSFCI